MQNRDAGIGQPFTLGDDPSPGVEGEIPVPMMLGVGDQHQVRERSRGQLERFQRKVAPDIAIDQQEGVGPEHVQGPVDAAAGLERHRAFLAVAQRQAIASAVAGVLADHFAVP